MKFFEQLYKGLFAYVDGAKFIYKHKLWIYFVAPVILGIGFYFLGEWLTDQGHEVNADASSMHTLMVGILEKLSFETLGYMFMESQKYIAVMFLSTVWALLSERAEELLTGNEYPFVWKYYIADIKRGLRINIWSLIQEYIIFFVWLIISMILGLPEWTNTAAALIIGFWYYGFGYMDYVLERRRMNITQSVHFARRNAGLAVGLGIIYSVAFEFVPLGMGLLVAPVAMVGATLVMHDMVDLSNNRYASKKEDDPPETLPA